MISTRELAAAGALSTVQLAKLRATEGAGEGNDAGHSEGHVAPLRPLIDVTIDSQQSLYVNLSTVIVR